MQRERERERERECVCVSVCVCVCAKRDGWATGRKGENRTHTHTPSLTHAHTHIHTHTHAHTHSLSVSGAVLCLPSRQEGGKGSQGKEETVSDSQRQSTNTPFSLPPFPSPSLFVRSFAMNFCCSWCFVGGSNKVASTKQGQGGSKQKKLLLVHAKANHALNSHGGQNKSGSRAGARGELNKAGMLREATRPTTNKTKQNKTNKQQKRKEPSCGQLCRERHEFVFQLLDAGICGACVLLHVCLGKALHVKGGGV